jgi:hypothetical protein
MSAERPPDCEALAGSDPSVLKRGAESEMGLVPPELETESPHFRAALEWARTNQSNPVLEPFAEVVQVLLQVGEAQVRDEREHHRASCTLRLPDGVRLSTTAYGERCNPLTSLSLVAVRSQGALTSIDIAVLPVLSGEADVDTATLLRTSIPTTLYKQARNSDDACRQVFRASTPIRPSSDDFVSVTTEIRERVQEHGLI